MVERLSYNPQSSAPIGAESIPHSATFECRFQDKQHIVHIHKDEKEGNFSEYLKLFLTDNFIDQ